jgi:hypothetical protein
MVCSLGAPVNMNISVVPMHWSPLVIDLLLLLFLFSVRDSGAKLLLMGCSLTRDSGIWHATSVTVRHLRKELRTGAVVISVAVKVRAQG